MATLFVNLDSYCSSEDHWLSMCYRQGCHFGIFFVKLIKIAKLSKIVNCAVVGFQCIVVLTFLKNKLSKQTTPDGNVTFGSKQGQEAIKHPSTYIFSPFDLEVPFDQDL